MNGIQYRKAQKEKQFAGCLGRMVNRFDFGSGLTGCSLLTDKPHNDGSLLPRSCSDVACTVNAHFGDQIGGKMTVPELMRGSSNKKANGTPMKTLIAQEMSKEVDSRRSPPNVVAKLMGLDTLPHQQHSSSAERSHSKGYSRRALSQPGMQLDCWEQDDSILEKSMHSDGCLCEEQNDYRDVYEIWQQSEKTNVRDNSPQKGRLNERRSDNAIERKMALVRQKFIEAKRLATDEKGRQSKEFQDALEVLSSNRDLFVKFLQEPHSLFSQHLYDMQSIHSSPGTKHITVLRPSKAIDNEKFVGSWKMGDKQSQIHHVTLWDKNYSGYSPTFSNQRFKEYAAPPTRIVVLKPSSGKTADNEVVALAPPSSSPKVLQGEGFFDGPEDEEAQESREVAKEITGQVHKMSHGRDETLLSSVFSNGYIGDDSSFNKSDNEYAVGNLSDSEIMSPPWRHSWDDINRNSSPFSSSAFSCASCSSEMSVCREAKKRLSERWAMIASNGNFSEQKIARRSSSTLGEMLALSDINRTVKSEARAIDKEHEPRESTSDATRKSSEEVGVADSPESLLRFRCLPVSSMVYGTGLNVEVSESEAGETEISKELKKAKNAKSSLKGKVSSLFFSRNKKTNKEKYSASHSKDGSQSATRETPGSSPFPGKSGDDASHCANSSYLADCLSPVLSIPSCNSVPNFIGAAAKQVIISKEEIMSMSKPVMTGNISENQDQPSPISVLEPPFEKDDSTVPELSAKINFRGAELPPESNLIDKSPPIESITRTLSWDDSCAEIATPLYSLKPSSTSEEQEWPLMIQALLSEAGLDGNIQLDSFSARWHAPDSPLDPTLRSKYANPNDKELLEEAKQRQRRSNRKLMFDCVNAALIEYGSDRSARGMLCFESQKWLIEGTSAMLVDNVWGQMKEWLFSEGRSRFEDNGDSSSLVVEWLVRKEVVGKGWSDNMRVELDSLGREIENKLLEEVVEDAIVHLRTCV